ncbi:DEAD/DEAH box helicase family protein, partial [Ferrovibrio sp.]|uniref:DEAD/DEAH box helicase family protein n=1 Tax=Ferrovibrio sp. TaxID=1917215 RepID=UPI001B6284CE
MVDFRKMRADGAKNTPVNPREIFQRLPKPPEINDLYTSQSEVLDAWFDRREENDLVIKLNTGGGKTLVGLLIAQSHMSEKRAPVLYLCSTVQLVEQTVAKAIEYGIPAVRYEKGQPLPQQYENGEAVLVSTYQALFNGKSRFGIRGTMFPAIIGMTIMDDAHVSFSSVREAFTFEILKDKHQEAYRYLTGLFRVVFRDLNKDGEYDDVVSGKDFGVLEVPYWAWLDKSREVKEYIRKISDAIDPFSWPLIRDSFHLCHLLISKDAATITPLFPLVEMFPSFDQCPRRIYMSATIADDSDIVRTFDASPDKVSNPIVSTSLAGVSERMILIPELVKLNDQPISPLIKKIINDVIMPRNAGSLILVPSSRGADAWTDIAHLPKKSDAVPAAIEHLKGGGQKTPIVLVNRYDGIDLKDDACRILVMDGLPMGTSDYDHFRAMRMSSDTVNNILAQRIEQGIGRGARGPHDYCIVILSGTKLVAWIGKNSNLNFLTSATRGQIDIGRIISNEVKNTEDLIKTIELCLARDSDWKKFHAEKLSEAVKAPPKASSSLEYAGLERKAFRHATQGNNAKGASLLVKAVQAEPDMPNPLRGWLYELAARLTAAGNDAIEAEKLQEYAYSMNRYLLRPRRKPSYVPLVLAGEQAQRIVAKLSSYHIKAALLAEFDSVVAFLNADSTSNQFEQALADFGEFIGLDTQRPESDFGIGPDVLWLIPNAKALIIEAKSKKKDGNPLGKEEHGQLLNAEHWFRGVYPDTSRTRVSVHPNDTACEDANPAGTLVLTLQNLQSLVSNV